MNTTRIDPTIFDSLPLGRDPVSVCRRIEAMEKLLERSFILPGTNRPVGLDFLIGLVPLVGDAITALMGSWIVWEARNLGLSKWQLTRMMGNVGFDAVLGLVPIVGDAADFFFRSNTRNLRIIRRHLDRHHPGASVIEG